jgi:hypothetical protein
MLARTRKLDCEPRAPFLHSFVRSVRVDIRLAEYATLEMRREFIGNHLGLIRAIVVAMRERA